MKCISRILWQITLIAFLFTSTGCGKTAYDLAFSESGSYRPEARYGADVSRSRVSTFAQDLCVVDSDVSREGVSMDAAGAAALFDLKNKKVLCAKAVHERMNPASLTKVMTALIALEYGSMDQELVATENTLINESGAATIKLKVGDRMTLEQALHALLLPSANDVANLIAENVAGSIEQFISLMNQKAMALGATNTHFMNAHGLTAADHYTTAYDLYLIFNEAIKHPEFVQIINMSSYQTTYYDKNGKPISKEFNTTNRYFTGVYKTPENVTVLGGKTGTTNAAGHCLILLCKDIRGNSYVAVTLRCANRDVCYSTMSDLLEEINK